MDATGPVVIDEDPSPEVTDGVIVVGTPEIDEEEPVCTDEVSETGASVEGAIVDPDVISGTDEVERYGELLSVSEAIEIVVPSLDSEAVDVKSTLATVGTGPSVEDPTPLVGAIPLVVPFDSTVV